MKCFDCCVAVDALPQKVQLAFTPLEEPLPSIEFLEAFARRFVQAVDLVSDTCGLKVCANALEVRTPTLRVPSDGDAVLCTLSDAGGLAEIDLPSHARADETAGVSDQGPTDG